jgi:hypothetical protein
MPLPQSNGLFLILTQRKIYATDLADTFVYPVHLISQGCIDYLVDISYKDPLPEEMVLERALRQGPNQCPCKTNETHLSQPLVCLSLNHIH